MRKDYLNAHIKNVHKMDPITEAVIHTKRIERSRYLESSEQPVCKVRKTDAIVDQNLEMEPCVTGAPDPIEPVKEEIFAQEQNWHSEDYVELHADSSEFDVDLGDLDPKKRDKLDQPVEEKLQLHENKSNSIKDGQCTGPSSISETGTDISKEEPDISREESEDSVFWSDTDSDKTVEVDSPKGEKVIKETITLILIKTKTYKDGRLIKDETIHTTGMSKPRNSDVKDVLRDAIAEMTRFVEGKETTESGSD